MAPTSAHPQPALLGGGWGRQGRAEHDGEAENKLWGSQRMEKRTEETTQQGWQVPGERPVCWDRCQAVRTQTPEPRAQAHRGQRSAGRCLVSTAARRAGHPGETPTAEREAEEPLSSPGWHSQNPASSMLMFGIEVACVPIRQWPWCGWHGARVGMPAGSANPAVPFPGYPQPLHPRSGGSDSPSPTLHRCRALDVGSPEAPAQQSGPGKLPHPGPQQSHKPLAVAHGSSRGRSWGKRGYQHIGAKGTSAQAGPSAPGKWPPA